MAYIRKRFGKWQVEIKKKNTKSVFKTFIQKSSASKWAKEVEYQIDREQYEDFSDSAKLSLGDLLIRYRDEITPTTRNVESEILVCLEVPSVRGGRRVP